MTPYPPYDTKMSKYFLVFERYLSMPIAGLNDAGSKGNPMPKNHESEHDGQKKDNTDNEIIELSEIAIGITPEDDAIVELTEGLIDEAFVGFTGATSELIEEDSQMLDLSGSHGDTADESDTRRETSDEMDESDDDIEKDIIEELDNYFGSEDDVVPFERIRTGEIPDLTPADRLDDPAGRDGALEDAPAEVSDDLNNMAASQLDEALERVIRKMFAEKINRILDDVIERTVTEEITQLRDYLLGMTGKKK